MDIQENEKIYFYVLLKDGKWEDFYRIANIIEMNLKVSFKTQLNDFDSKYWDFEFRNTEVVLHYHEMIEDVEIFTDKEYGKEVMEDAINRILKSKIK